MIVKTVAVVMPCYNEELALPLSVERIRAILGGMISRGEISPDSFVLCVDDGSKDKTWEVISGLAADNNPVRVRGVGLAHNRGHQYALYAGLMEAAESADAVISIDADLQDDPEVIVEMVRRFNEEGDEIVYGVRASRATDTAFKRITARGFYKFQNLMGLETVYDHADYRLMSARALDILGQYQEHNLFLRGIIPQIGLKSSIVTYDRGTRVAGESKYPLKKMLAFSIDGITSFSARPMRWIFGTGVAILLIDILIAVYVLVALISGRAVSGWSSLMLSVWFLGSLILIAIGIVGEYIGKIFVEVKNRPRYNISRRTPLEF